MGRSILLANGSPRVLAGVLLALVTLAPAPLLAQTETADAEPGIDQIVVTATRSYAQSIQEIPLAVTALNPDSLQRQGLETLSDISRSIPGLVVQEEGGGQNKIVIRGITTGGVTSSTDTSEQALVSVYLDDVPISIQGSTPDIRVYDLERVEFLRGPQGTLFGAGAMAGTVRYITRKPDSSQVEGSMELSAATTRHGSESYSARGMINVPILKDSLGLRVTGYRGRDGGYIDNIGRGKKDANKQETAQIRSALRYDNQGPLTLDLSYFYGRIKTGGYNRNYNDLGDFTYSTLTPEGLTDNFHIGNLAGELDLGGVKLLSSTSYMDRETNQLLSSEDVLTYFFGLNGIAPATIRNHIKEFVQEFRISSDLDGPIRFQLGAFYEHQTRRYLQDMLAPGLDAAFGIDSEDYGAFGPDRMFSSDTSTRTQQLAFFGEATWSPSNAIDLTVGLRQFDWKQKYRLYTGGLAGALGPGQPLTLLGRSKANGVNPRASVTYHVDDDTIVYAEAARGFRYGGVNQAVPLQFCAGALAADGLTEAPEDYGPDKLWTYTVGEKASFLNRRVTLNVAGFLTDWSGVQTRHLLEQCGYYFTQNAGRIRSKGVEVESRVRVGDGLTLTFSGSYTDAKARESMPDIAANSGDRVPYFPRFLGSLGAEYRVPLSNGEISLQGDLSYREATGTQFSPLDPNYREIPSSTVLNAALTWTRGSTTMSIFGRNLTDAYVVQAIRINSYPGVAPGDANYIGRPRTFGVRVRQAF